MNNQNNITTWTSTLSISLPLISKADALPPHDNHIISTSYDLSVNKEDSPFFFRIVKSI